MRVKKEKNLKGEFTKIATTIIWVGFAIIILYRG